MKTKYYLRGAKATFELTRQIIKFLEFLVDFFVAVLQREMKRKKEQNSETVASGNTDMKGKHCMKE